MWPKANRKEKEEERQRRIKNLHGVKSCVKDTMMCPVF